MRIHRPFLPSNAFASRMGTWLKDVETVSWVSGRVEPVLYIVYSIGNIALAIERTYTIISLPKYKILTISSQPQPQPSLF
jgi:hypothetical protein